ncbi:MAG: DUF92 domain-containing protein [bacterium]
MIGAILAFAAAAISYRYQLLTPAGAVLAFFVGWLIFEWGRFSYSLPLVGFFITSNILSRVGRTRKLANITIEKTGQRDYLQVLANGSIPTLLVVAWHLSQDFVYNYLYLTAVASATADTWATEMGLLSKRPPRSILTLKKVAAGSSGGVSVRGTCAASVGAFLIAAMGLFVLSAEQGLAFRWSALVTLMFAALLSECFDSVLGACCQVKYRCSGCGTLTEKRAHCAGHDTTLYSGFAWMTNDTVNFLAILAGVLVAWLGLHLFILARVEA